MYGNSWCDYYDYVGMVNAGSRVEMEEEATRPVDTLQPRLDVFSAALASAEADAALRGRSKRRDSGRSRRKSSGSRRRETRRVPRGEKRLLLPATSTQPTAADQPGGVVDGNINQKVRRKYPHARIILPKHKHRVIDQPHHLSQNEKNHCRIHVPRDRRTNMTKHRRDNQYMLTTHDELHQSASGAY